MKRKPGQKFQQFKRQKIEDECYRGWDLVGNLGKGSSSIVKLVKKNNLEAAMKISKFVRMPHDKETYDRDVFFLDRLQTSGVVPKVYENWICPINQGFVVMELFKENLLDYLRRVSIEQRPKFQEPTRVIPEWVLHEMLNCVAKVSDKKIIHADVKLANFLINPRSKKVVITDFGYSFNYDNFPPREHVGWHYMMFKCIPPTEFIRDYNLWNLNLSIFSDTSVEDVVIMKNDGTFQKITILPNLSEELNQFLLSQCKSPPWMAKPKVAIEVHGKEEAQPTQMKSNPSTELKFPTTEPKIQRSL